MAKVRAKKKDDGASAPAGDVGVTVPSRGLEALGIAMLIGAFGLCLSLFSFDPTDSGTSNLVGPLGFGIASVILGGIGVAGYVVGLLAVGFAAATLFGRVRWPSFLAIGSSVGITVGACLLAQLVVGAPVVLGYPAGGALGAILAALLQGVAGPAGAALVGMGLILLGILGVSELSFSFALQEGFRFVRFVGAVLTGRLGIWREAQVAARQRESELVEAARSRRAQAQMEEDERARLLVEDLGEKKRLAVLKATAKAEEKALKKIAALDAKDRVERDAEEVAAASVEPDSIVQTPEADPVDRAQEDAREGVLAPEGLAFSEASTDGFDVQDADIDDAESLSAPMPAPEEVAVGLPGPAAEPEIIIRDHRASIEFDDVDERSVDEPVEPVDALVTEAFDVQPSADVIDELDRRTHLPGHAPAPEASEPAQIAAAAAAAAAKAAVEASAAALAAGPIVARDGCDLATPDVPPAKEVPDEALVIHERKEAGPDFDDEGRQLVEPEAPEKLVYELPPLKLLDYEGADPEPVDGQLLKEKATRLENKLRTYGVDGKVTAIRPGPVVTTYEYQPAPGVKVSKIQGLSDDIAMSMEALRVRIVAPIPGRGVVGIELPNRGRENVYLKEVVAHEHFRRSKSFLTLALGKDAEGDIQVRDLQKMPHLLIAGTTGSGKSVAINTMVLSVLYKATPDQVKFIMIDPKMLELSLYNDIPHLLLPVVTDAKKASLALQWAVDEMERRYQLLSESKVRDIGGFNKKLEGLRVQRARMAEEAKLDEDEFAEAQAATEKKGMIKDPWRGQDLPDEMPYIVVLIDEFADLMSVAAKDVEGSVQRLAQKARAAGIHVLLATQRPSTDVITGVIKNNFPSRVSFRVASRHDSSTILNSPGAENLLGMGDSLFLSVASPSPQRIHCAFVSETEVERVVDFWKAQATPVFDESILRAQEASEDTDGFSEEDRDEHYDLAVKIVTDTQRASISALQRRLRVGYNRAARMIEMMESEGVVGSPSGPKGEREVLVRALGGDDF